MLYSYFADRISITQCFPQYMWIQAPHPDWNSRNHSVSVCIAQLQVQCTGSTFWFPLCCGTNAVTTPVVHPPKATTRPSQIILLARLVTVTQSLPPSFKNFSARNTDYSRCSLHKPVFCTTILVYCTTKYWYELIKATLEQKSPSISSRTQARLKLIVAAAIIQINTVTFC